LQPIEDLKRATLDLKEVNALLDELHT